MSTLTVRRIFISPDKKKKKKFTKCKSQNHFVDTNKMDTIYSLNQKFTYTVHISFFFFSNVFSFFYIAPESYWACFQLLCFQTCRCERSTSLPWLLSLLLSWTHCDLVVLTVDPLIYMRVLFNYYFNLFNLLEYSARGKRAFLWELYYVARDISPTLIKLQNVNCWPKKGYRKVLKSLFLWTGQFSSLKK